MEVLIFWQWAEGGGVGVIPLKKYSIIGGARNVTNYNQPHEVIERSRKHR